MTEVADGTATLPLREHELVELVASVGGPGARVRSVRRSAFATSFPLFELDVVGPSGEVPVIVKDLRWSSLDDDARRAKSRESHDPSRELGVYRELLASVDGPPRFLGGRGDRRSGTAWLAIERVEGRELYQWGAPEAWGRAAQWLGAFHREWRSRSTTLRSTRRRRLPLLHHDAEHFGRLATDVRRHHGGGSLVDDLLRAWLSAACDLLRVPPTLSHGECYASNVLVTSDGRVAVVDWETAAVSSGWSDLAALTLGWSEAARELLLEQYLGACGPTDGVAEPRRLLDAARLQVCIQWLGTDPRWQPPSEHRTDWLAEASGILDGTSWPW